MRGVKDKVIDKTLIPEWKSARDKQPLGAEVTGHL
jgi:hypothetical protein